MSSAGCSRSSTTSSTPIASSSDRVWRRLRTLLETHAEAEERHFYPELLSVGSGAGDKDSAADETIDAVRDHNEIRDAIAETERHEVGTPGWWAGVDATRRANGDHMAEEEREALADFRRRAAPPARHELGVRFAGFEAVHAGGVDSRDKDPEHYVDRMTESDDLSPAITWC